MNIVYRKAVYLGAILHDNGKFWQRAGGSGTGKRHWILSKESVSSYFGNDLVEKIVENHHESVLWEAVKESRLSAAEAVLAAIVCESDNLASKEREYDGDFRKRPLNSIFGQVKIEETGVPNTELKFPIGPLNVKDFEMPQADVNFERTDYLKRWESFEEEMGKAKKAGDIDFGTLYYLYKKYLWCIPSAYYKSAPDISLFEHSRLTAALATCIYDFLEEKNQLDNWEIVKSREEQRFILLFADLSGIQDFIYNIAHDNALKALKGRSFFLQQFMESVAMQILKDFNLWDANLLFNSGGKFYMLLPNTGQALNKLQKVESEVNTHLLQEYKGLLSVVFAHDILSGEDFSQKVINSKWHGLDKKLRRNKERKLASSVQSDDFFETNTPYGDVKLCDATSWELGQSSEIILEAGKSQKVDEFNYKTIRLSNQSTIFQIPETDIAGAFTGGWKENKFINSEQRQSIRVGQKLKKDAVAFYLTTQDTKIQLAKGVFLDFEKGEKGFLLNDDDFYDRLKATSKGWKFYGGNWFPKSEGNSDFTAEFKELRDGAEGIKRLAVLRMDVDNLGEVFRNGLKKPAFSRIVQLSNLLDFFFSGYLNKLQDLWWSIERGVAETGDVPLGKSIQIIYAGGDDLSIVGKWNVIPDVALWVNEQFRTFTGHNPSLTISGGIALFGEKFPLFKVAERAGEAEKKAKNYKRRPRQEKGAQTENKKDIERNAVSFLENPMSWDDFKVARDYMRRFYQWMEVGMDSENGRKSKLSRAVIQIVYEIFYEFSGRRRIDELTQEEVEKLRYGRWRWIAAYRISRMGKQYPVFEHELTQLAAELFTNHATEKEFLTILFTAAQWADFLTRKNDLTDDNIQQS